MKKAMIHEVLNLISQGWRPYNEIPDSVVYERLGCPRSTAKRGDAPFWFVRCDLFLCIACPKHCTLARPEGFILPLPLQYAVKADAPSRPTPGELVQRKALLRVDEAAYCVNISERAVYDWIAEGKLRRAKEHPVRVSAEDVAFCMRNFED